MNSRRDDIPSHIAPQKAGLTPFLRILPDPHVAKAYQATNPHGWTKSVLFRTLFYLAAPLDSEVLYICSNDLHQGQARKYLGQARSVWVRLEVTGSG